MSLIVNDPFFLTLDEVLRLHDLAVDEMEQLVLGVAKGETSKEQVAAFFRDRLSG
jgi:anthranilate phosphoribosyltransferase